MVKYMSGSQRFWWAYKRFAIRAVIIVGGLFAVSYGIDNVRLLLVLGVLAVVDLVGVGVENVAMWQLDRIREIVQEAVRELEG